MLYVQEVIDFYCKYSLVGPSFAADGEGRVEEVMICTGDNTQKQPATGWAKLGLFKLSDGNWFGTYMNYIKSDKTKSDFDDNSIYSTVLYASSMGRAVKVRANNAEYTVCGVTAWFLWAKPGDYVRVLSAQ